MRYWEPRNVEHKYTELYLSTLCKTSCTWVEEYRRAINEIAVSPSYKNLVSVALFDLVLEHHQAVLTLVDDRLGASATALLRPMVEGLVRGTWIKFVPNEDRIREILQKEAFPSYGAMLRDLNGTGQNTKTLTLIKTKIWSEFCDYTHGGSRQIGARLTRQNIGRKDNLKALSQTLRYANVISSMAVTQTTLLAQDTQLPFKLDSVYDELFGPPNSEACSSV